MSLNFGRISPQTSDLAALEHLKTIHHLILLARWRLHFDRIFFILASKEDNHKISDIFEFRPDSNTNCGISYPRPFGEIPIDL